ncbi:receptor-interacting serine/threonine-protein kinase 1-like isoform X2 [Dreissena polymorpha]|uniref:Death domain-containing protein n=1 Tax=Dreissena polymorpha TaxID=45954 RepID=A0A9D4G5H6_DREPO|nr:receptor-interacting serine/threonine-protein kinase 1-like isoform X2 [Dreissena polymorpha]KAH3809201.1 hypothetical protein DPMN_137562 [Dreissena polymorpha]
MSTSDSDASDSDLGDLFESAFATGRGTTVIENGGKVTVIKGSDVDFAIPGMAGIRISNRVNAASGISRHLTGSFPGINIGDGSYVATGSGERHGRRKHRKHKSHRRHSPREPRSLTVSTEPPSTSDLDHVCKNIGRRWKKLGSALGISGGRLEGIEYDYRTDGQYEMCWQVLQKWQRSVGSDATVRLLARTLDEIGENELASELPV